MPNNAKLTGIDALSVIAKSESSLVYALSERQVEALLGLLLPLSWRTRWDNLPSDFDYKAFSSELENTLMTPLDICQLVADCILDLNSPTRAALIEALADSDNPILPNNLRPINPETIITEPSPSTENILEGCDYDVIYGACLQIVDFTFSLVIDAYELIESANNAVEAAATMADDIPFLGASIEFLDFIQETAQEAYLANATIEKKNELACELFCNAIGTCSLSIDSIYNFFSAKYLLPFPSDLESMLAQISLIASGEDIFNASNALFWAVILDGYKWLGVSNVSQVLRMVASFLNDPNSDWLTLCADCVSPIVPVTVNFDSGGYENYTVLSGSVQALGNGGNALRNSRNCSGCSNIARFDVLFDYSQSINSVSVDVFGLFALIEVYVRVYDASNTLIGSYGGNETVSPSAWNTKTYSTVHNGVRRVQIECSSGSGFTPIFMDNRIDNVVIS